MILGWIAAMLLLVPCTRPALLIGTALGVVAASAHTRSRLEGLGAAIA
ncbi:MAG: hypothetical protein GY711_25405 [bacterium]|nr:hypothetical protein [bacterium]